MNVTDIEVFNVAKAWADGLKQLNRYTTLADAYAKWERFKRDRPKQFAWMLREQNFSLRDRQKTA